ncbi:hypothetical protein OA958_04400 [Bacteroidota bacterium]|nr:hypothetical protein [Bacteroidota bacterium]
MKNIEIIEYQKWMKSNVIKLFTNQYNLDENQFENKFEKLYNDKFQKKKCIRIVALINKEVIGFQSYFYWPYKYGNITYNTFQSGNSIVNKHYRGQGVFGLMLEKIDEIILKRKIDFLIGFPVKESIGSFKRKKWLNNINLLWFIKPISYNPLISCKKTNKKLKKDKLYFNFKMKDHIALENNQTFNEYRNKFCGEIMYYQYHEKKSKIELCYKLSKRKKIIKELIIGGVEFDNFDEDLMNNAFEDFIRTVKKHKMANFISIAISDNTNIFDNIIKKQGFISLKKKVHFIYKGNEKVNLKNILLFRSDIDTW